ncbi:MAG: DNA primase [Pseudomonadales bacterium]|nr:DNA primase [Pseudomonadales bacterium]
MAGKIPQNFIDDLIDRSDIVELIDSRVKLKKSGRNYTACCPFHDEKTPSFSVNPDKQFYYCFGCGAGGNVVSFIMDHDRSEFIEAIETLASHNGVQVPREHNPQAEKLHKAKKSIYDLLQQASEYYQIQLRQHAKKSQAVDYLKQRGLSGAIAQQFQIGYAPPGWDNLLKNIGSTEEQQKLLLDGGMLIEKDKGGCYDRFRERLIFPIRDSRGRTIAFGGRVFNDDKPKYLNSPETPVFHKQQELYGLYEARQANRHLQRLIMVEGYMDVVALAQYGISYAVATLGTAAGTIHMEKVFRQCSEVIFCFDGDDAGRKAALRALDAVIPLMEAGRQAKFLFLPQGEDPDSHVRNIGQEAFVVQLDGALSLSEYLFQHAETDLDLAKPDDKASLINKLMPQIQAMPAGTFQELMLRSLSEKSGLPVEDIKRLEIKAKKAPSAQNKPPPKAQNTAPPPPQPNHGDTGSNEDYAAYDAAHYHDQPHDQHDGYNNPPPAHNADNYWGGYDDSDTRWHDTNADNTYADNRGGDKKGAFKGKKGFAFDDEPKPRQKIPPSQRKVKRTPIRTVISLLLIEPSLINEIDTDFVFDNTQESQFFQRVVSYIRENNESNAGIVLGYWLAEEKAAVTPLLGLQHSYEDKNAMIEEFQQSLQQIEQQQLRQQMLHLQEALKNESDYEKAKLLTLHYFEVAKLVKNVKK